MEDVELLPKRPENGAAPVVAVVEGTDDDVVVVPPKAPNSGLDAVDSVPAELELAPLRFGNSGFDAFLSRD